MTTEATITGPVVLVGAVFAQDTADVEWPFDDKGQVDGLYFKNPPQPVAGIGASQRALN